MFKRNIFFNSILTLVVSSLISIQAAAESADGCDGVRYEDFVDLVKGFQFEYDAKFEGQCKSDQQKISFELFHKVNCPKNKVDDIKPFYCVNKSALKSKCGFIYNTIAAESLNELSNNCFLKVNSFIFNEAKCKVLLNPSDEVLKTAKNNFQCKKITRSKDSSVSLHNECFIDSYFCYNEKKIKVENKIPGSKPVVKPKSKSNTRR